MSSVFWFLLDIDILKRVLGIGFESCGELRKEIVDGDKGGSPGRVRRFTALSHHIDVTEQVKIRQNKAAPLAGCRH